MNGYRLMGAIEGLQYPEIEGLQEDDGEDDREDGVDFDLEIRQIQATARQMGSEPAATLVEGTLSSEEHAVDKGWRSGRWQCQVLIANGADDSIKRQCSPSPPDSNARALGMNRAAEDFDEMARKLRAAALDILAERDPASNGEAPLRCSPGGPGHAPGWCTDRADHRPWSADRSSSAASAASTSAASSTNNVRDSWTRHSPLTQWGEGSSAATLSLMSSFSARAERLFSS